jgi:ketosteroid isomerase-like protein
VPRSVTALICAALLAGGVAACGESDQEQAREVVQQYIDASNADDFDQVCDLYSDEFKQQLVAGANCPAFVQEQSSAVEQEFELVQISVNGDRGTAEINAVQKEEGGPRRIRLQLQRTGDEWQVSGFE